MLIQPRLEIPRPTFVPTVTAKAPIRLVPSAPVNPVSYAPGPVSFFGNGWTPMATPPASSSPAPRILPLPDQFQPDPAPKVSFLSGLGGIVGGGIGLITGGLSGAVTGYNAGSQLLGGGSGGVAHPQLPTLSGGGPFANTPYTGGIPTPGQVTGGSFFGSPGTAVARVHGHYTKGTKKNPSHWSSRRRPRMNPMNVHAGRRAITRIRAAEKLFHRFLSVSHPGHTGRVKMKRLKSGSR